MPALRARLPTASRALSRHRRIVAAIAAAIAVVAGLDSLAPRSPAGTAVVAAAHDLPAGATLKATDLQAISLPSNAVPAGAITAADAVIGRTISGALRRGELLTDVRLATSELAVPEPGMVAAPIRFADAQAVELLQPGERVDVLAASSSPQGDAAPSTAVVVASDVRVIAIPSADDGARDNAALDSGLDGALVVVAATPAQARALAQAAVSARLSAVVIN